jgi:hypothetical protein
LTGWSFVKLIILHQNMEMEWNKMDGFLRNAEETLAKR